MRTTRRAHFYHNLKDETICFGKFRRDNNLHIYIWNGHVVLTIERVEIDENHTNYTLSAILI